MANSATLITMVDAPAGGLSPIYEILVDLDTSEAFTVLTPGGMITLPDASTKITGTPTSSIWVLGVIKGKVPGVGTVQLRSGTNRVLTIDLAQNVGMRYQANSFLFKCRPGEAFTVVPSGTSSTELLFQLAMGEVFKACY
jgi:hypothetical protein